MGSIISSKVQLAAKDGQEFRITATPFVMIFLPISDATRISLGVDVSLELHLCAIETPKLLPGDSIVCSKVQLVAKDCEISWKA